MRSSIAHRVSFANRQVKRTTPGLNSNKILGVFGLIGTFIILAYGATYAVVEYALFGGDTKFAHSDPATACYDGLEMSGFDLIELEKYDEWFDDDTTLEFAEVGTFKGAQGIREYVEFVNAIFFEKTKYLVKPKLRLIQLTEDECVMLSAFALQSQTKPEYTSGGVCLERGVGAKIYYTVKPFHVRRIHIFYTVDYQSHLFGTYLDDDKVRDYICDVMESDCPDVFQFNNLTTSSCREKYDSLPMATAGGRIDGNTKGCRIVHATMAVQNPKHHCPHLSFDPLEDDENNVLCQKSANKSPKDFFEDYELDTVRKVIAENGLPASSMYQECKYRPDGLNYDDDEFDLGISNSMYTADMSNRNFLLMFSIFVWATIILTGFGLELFVWSLFLHGKWGKNQESGWRLAQFMFPILGSVSVGLAYSHNYLALLTIVLTLWKFGFPETVLGVYAGLYDQHLSPRERAKDLIDGLGTAMHHVSASLYIAVVVTNLVPASREVIEVVFPLLSQHWFVLLRYDYRNWYIGIETVLEVWLEWTILSNLEELHRMHWINGIICVTMIVSHWMFFLAGFMGMFQRQENVMSRLKSMTLDTSMEASDLRFIEEVIEEEDTESE